MTKPLVPYDASVMRSPAGGVSVQNMVIDDEIGAALAKLNDRDITVVVDSCHSGTVTRGLQGPRRNLAARSPQLSAFTRSIAVDPDLVLEKSHRPSLTEDVPAEAKIILWAAVSPTQLALIDEEAAPNYHGLFTVAFVNGLKTGEADKNKNGVISN